MNDTKIKEKIENMLNGFDMTPKYQVDVMGKKIDVPVKYLDASAFMVFFSISSEKIKKQIPRRLSPVKIIGDRCLLGVTFFDYRDCSAGAYHEFTFSIPVIVDGKLSIPIIPLMYDSIFKKFGYYVTLMGADTDMGKKHIEKIFPYPLCDKDISINLKEENDFISSSIYEGGEKIVSVTLPTPVNYKFERKDYNTYYSKDDKIYNVRLNTFSYNKIILKMKNVNFDLGNHEIAETLRRLDLSEKPFFAIYYKKATEIASGPKEV